MGGHPLDDIRRGRYLLPQAPGYSIEIFPESLDLYRHPDGAAWLEYAQIESRIESQIEPTANGWRSSLDDV